MKKKQGQKNEKIRTFGIATLLIFGLGILLAIAGLSNMVGEVRDNLISKRQMRFWRVLVLMMEKKFQLRFLILTNELTNV